MRKNNLVLLAVIAVCVLSVSIYGYKSINRNQTENIKQNNIQTAERTKTLVEEGNATDIRNKDYIQKDDKVKENSKKANFVKRANLYSELPPSAIPLSAISQLADLPLGIQMAASKIAKNNNIFMVQKYNNNLLIISDNPANIRHDVDFTEISIDNGHQTRTTLGYSDKINDSDNDIWEYNPDTHQPIRHTKYNKDGDVEFTEVWNYSPNEPIKYEMKDSDDKVISLRKETLQNGTDLRIEHLVYDKDGNTKMNVSVTYDGEDIKRFTYYNSEKPDISGSVFSDYYDDLKIKETVYTSDLKHKETYTSTYKDGIREDITKWDNQNREVQKLLSKE